MTGAGTVEIGLRVEENQLLRFLKDEHLLVLRSERGKDLLEELRKERVDLKIARRVAAATRSRRLGDGSPHGCDVRVKHVAFLIVLKRDR